MVVGRRGWGRGLVLPHGAVLKSGNEQVPEGHLIGPEVLSDFRLDLVEVEVVFGEVRVRLPVDVQESHVEGGRMSKIEQSVLGSNSFYNVGVL